jgi:soluble lytic murein transglycosylase
VKRFGRSAIVLTAVLIGCSSAAILYGEAGSPPPSLPPPPLTTPQPAAPIPSVRTPAPGELVDFSPLGLDPNFRSAAEALDAGDPARAGIELEAALAKNPGARTPTVDLWLGRIWERALLPARALEACERGANSSAELSAYAGLCVARSLNALGRPREALLRLDGLSVPEAVLAERELLIARSAALAGDTERAIQTYRGIVAASGETPEPDSALALAELLVSRAAGAGDAEEALGLARRVRVLQSPDRELSRRAEQLEARALAGLPAARQNVLSRLSSDERLNLSLALLRARDNEAAEREATELLRSLPASERFERVGCEAELVLAKARAALRRNQEATDGLAEARARCLGDDDRGARIWFLSGRYAASAGQPAAAVTFYAGVESRFPAHSLADDARYYGAQSYLELGAEDRFTELSSSLPERYPKGDMVAEGLFRLALRRMDRGAWSEAALLLEQGVSWVGDSDATRGFDLVGRERYFRARALHALGKSAPARAELAELIRAYPLSYYMLQAYSRLHALDPEAARNALSAAKSAANSEPFRVVRRQQLDQPGFSRMLELLRIGELDSALKELDQLGLSRAETASDILWGVADVYGRAGFAQLSAELAKRRMSEIAQRWPAAGWERAWQVAFPRPYSAIVQAEARENGVDPALVYAVMREESAFDPDAVSPAAAYGLMQLIVPTARTLARRDNLVVTPQTLRRPKVNVALGCRALAEFSARFPDNPLLAIPAYNAGPGRPARWLKEHPSSEFDLWVELVPFPETRRYTKRVLSSRAVYAFLYDSEAADSRLRLPIRVTGNSPAAP